MCNHLKTIGKYAFCMCSKIESFIFPNNAVTSLGDRAFEGNTLLKSIYLPASIETIGSRLFAFCGLESFILDPESKLKVITWGCLYYCDNIVDFTIPSSVERAFNIIVNNHKLINIYVDPNNKNLTSVDGVVYSKNKESILIFPCGRVGSYRVVDGTISVGICAFNGAHVSEIVLPDSVYTIDQYGLGSYDLNKVTLPNGLHSIYNYAFSNTKLKEVIIPESVKEICNEAFYNCKSLEHVQLPSQMVFFGGGVFNQCPPNISITFSSSSGYIISDDYFVYTDIIDSAGQVDSTGKKATLYIGSDSKVIIKNTVKELGENLFYNKDFIKTLEFEETSQLQIIGKNAFCSCKTEYITLPKSIKQIDQTAFYYSNIKSLIINPEAEITELPAYCLSVCKNLNDVQLPNSIINIGPHCFENSNIKNFKFPLGLKIIGEYAFSGCSELTGFLIIQPSIESIGEYAFSNCNRFNYVIYEGYNNPNFPSSIFNGMKIKALYVLPNYKGEIFCGYKVTFINRMLNLKCTYKYPKLYTVIPKSILII